LGLLALLAIPAILALHLFKRRFRPQVVSALFLWGGAERMPLSGRKRERLQSSLSLWSEILAAICLALAFSGPQGCTQQASEHLVIVLDASASLGAHAATETFRDRVVQCVEERVRALPPGSRVTLIESGTRPSLLAGPAAFPS